MTTDFVPWALTRLYGDDFARDPQTTYRKLRSIGPIAPAEIAPDVPALIVTSHRAALAVLHNTATFSKDSRLWADLNAGRIPPDSPVLPLMGYRASVLYADGEEHARLRRALDDCLARVSTHDLSDITRRATLRLIADAAPRGHADVMAELADVVPLYVFAELLGCPTDVASRMVAGCQDIIAAGPKAAAGAAEFVASLLEVIQLKQRAPGQDITSWMLAHPARMTGEEILNQLYCLVGAGMVPTAAWIAHSLRLLLTDDAYVGDLTEGTVTVRRALEKALWERAPMANFSVHYARNPVVVEGVSVPAGVPVLISHAAANTDPMLPPDLGFNNRSHLAWSAGPHRCPAVTQATVIAQVAIETVMDRLWDMRLAEPGEPPVNRPGPFHQCPVAMHVRFSPKEAPVTPAPASGGSA
ncbi:cytochrome P450 [Streptomyces sp. RFCAC02]|uniref:cytochrome P450 n=1 Tax=Streptomyces sp. RFCAC02 TaxID=2499143 RepID=UPI0010200E36|nr:cytochrome P450 [Streptomyces sp. RFCAC02]